MWTKTYMYLIHIHDYPVKASNKKVPSNFVTVTPNLVVSTHYINRFCFKKDFLHNSGVILTSATSLELRATYARYISQDLDPWGLGNYEPYLQ
jgi:hypothetical protein